MAGRRTAIRAAVAARWLIGAVVITACSGGASATGRRVDITVVFAAHGLGAIAAETSRMPRAGNADALLSPSIPEAVRDEAEGRVAIAYVEWSGEVTATVGERKPWREIA